MTEIQNNYTPDYAVPTGWILEEQLEAKSLSQAGFAKLCGRSTKLINQIINGTAPVEPQTALQFERVLGLDASIWMNLESAYRLFLEKQAEHERLTENIDWAKNFPVRDMKSLGLIPKDVKGEELVSQLLRFLEIGSPTVWRKQMNDITNKVHFKKQARYQLAPEPLSVWLKLGELEAQKQECKPYERSRFIKNLKAIRGLTTNTPQEFIPKMQALCNSAGVALAILPQFKRLPVCGMARWVLPSKPLISLTLRYKTNDHFWFSFFHEAAHILLHSKKDVFVDTIDNHMDKADEELEADIWASDFLIPKKDFQAFAHNNPSQAEIISFAMAMNIHPAIIVGRLQKLGFLGWNSPHNKLKAKLELTAAQLHGHI